MIHGNRSLILKVQLSGNTWYMWDIIISGFSAFISTRTDFPQQVVQSASSLDLIVLHQ